MANRILNGVTALGNAGSAQALASSTSGPADPVYTMTLNSASCAISLSAADTGRAQTITAVFKQDTTGGREVVHPNNVGWGLGSAPYLDKRANSTTVVQYVTYDNGTTWQGILALTGAVTPSLAVTSVTGSTAGSTITVGGTYTGSAPSNLEYSIDDGAYVAYSGQPAIVFTNGTFSFGITAPNGTGAHTVKVRAVGTTLASPNYSFNITAATAPAPGTASVSGTGDGTVTVTMTGAVANGSPITGYTVRRATVAGGPYTDVQTNGAIPFQDTGRTNGTPYYYVIAPVNAIGTGANSNEVSATPSNASWAPSAISATYAADSTDTVNTPDAGGSNAGKVLALRHLYDSTKYLGQTDATLAPALVTNGGANGTARALRFAAASAFLSSSRGSGGNASTMLDTGSPPSMTRYIAFSAKMNAAGVQRVIVAATSAFNIQWRFTAAGRGLSITNSGGSTAIDQASQDLLWHVFEVNIVAGAVTITVDGVQVATGTLTNAGGITASTFLIGGATTAGTVNEVGTASMDFGRVVIAPSCDATNRPLARTWCAAPYGITTA